MNYAEIKYNDIANGPGVRTSIFVSGCTHHCKGCFNEVAWDFNYGMPFTDETIDEIIESMKPSYIAGLTLLGGEPFEPANQKGLLPLLERVKQIYPDKNIWCFTGYLFDKDIMERMYNTYMCCVAPNGRDTTPRKEIHTPCATPAKITAKSPVRCSVITRFCCC